jgi:soluble lytic murein transglycosylase-like protein
MCMTIRAPIRFAVLVAAALPLAAAGADVAPLEAPGALHVPSFLPQPAYVTPDPDVRETAVYGYVAPAGAAKYKGYVEQAAREYDVDPALIHAIIHAESAHQPAAVSPKGAIGLMQVMPQTAARFGRVNLFDPEQNIRTGTRYLRKLQELFKNRLDLVLAAYNAGEQVVARLGRIPPYPETEAYVSAVTKLYERHRASAAAIR